MLARRKPRAKRVLVRRVRAKPRFDVTDAPSRTRPSQGMAEIPRRWTRTLHTRSGVWVASRARVACRRREASGLHGLHGLHAGRVDRRHTEMRRALHTRVCLCSVCVRVRVCLCVACAVGMLRGYQRSTKTHGDLFYSSSSKNPFKKHTCARESPTAHTALLQPTCFAPPSCAPRPGPPASSALHPPAQELTGRVLGRISEGSEGVGLRSVRLRQRRTHTL